MVSFPYFTVTAIGSEGSFCPLYLPVLQVITSPNSRLKQREQVYHPPAEDGSFKAKGRGLHLTGDSTHTNGDVLLGRGVQVLSCDGDHSSSGCWTLSWHDSHGFGVLTEIINGSLVTFMGGGGECSALTIVGNYDSSRDNYHHLKEPLVSYVFQEVGSLNFCLNLLIVKEKLESLFLLLHNCRC